MRPITADGLPILDRAGDLDNAYLATGYAMQGVTLAPPSGPGDGGDDHHRAPAAAARAVPARPLRAACRSPAPARRGRVPQPGMSPAARTLRVAIIGTGNIGTDLMIKVERSPLLELVGMAGIDPDSDGLRRARERGAHVTDRGLAGPARAGRRHRPRLRRDLGRAPIPSTPGCWPSAGSAAST